MPEKFVDEKFVDKIEDFGPGKIITSIPYEKPIVRTFLRSLPKQDLGSTNCFAVCMATILDVDVSEIPASADGATWDLDSTQKWLAKRYRMQILEITFGDSATIYPMSHKVPCIITGKSPRVCESGLHAVCAFTRGLEGFELWHDPHPSDDFLVGDALFASFFVPIDPRAVKPELEDRRPVMRWNRVSIDAPVGFEFGVLSSSPGHLELVVRKAGEEWPSEDDPNPSGRLVIAEGHKRFVIQSE